MNCCLLSFVTFVLSFCTLRIAAECYFPSYHNKTSPPGYERLKQLIGKRYFAGDGIYTYDVGICVSGIDSDPSLKDFGVIQAEKEGEKRPFKLGKFSNSTIISGSEWVLLQYLDGQPYGKKCGQESRKASLMFVCDKNARSDAVIRVLDENTEKISDCYYLFEIGHISICSAEKPPKGVIAVITSRFSVGSILILIFIISVTLYLIIGFLIQRSRGSKGFDQLPNYGFWQEIGNLIADGCDLVFRSRPKASNNLYPSMNVPHPRQTLQPDEARLVDEDDNDDHILPL